MLHTHTHTHTHTDPSIGPPFSVVASLFFFPQFSGRNIEALRKVKKKSRRYETKKNGEIERQRTVFLSSFPCFFFSTDPSSFFSVALLLSLGFFFVPFLFFFFFLLQDFLHVVLRWPIVSRTRGSHLRDCDATRTE